MMEKNEIYLLASDSLSAIGYELIELNYNRNISLQIFIDKDEGITIDDCAKASRHLSYVFAVKELDYKNLEVSSPGLDRLLRNSRDYKRFSGSLVKIKLNEPLEGKLKLVGQMLWEEGQFFLQIDERKLHILEESIQKVRLSS